LWVQPQAKDAAPLALGSLICQEEASSASLQRWLPQAHLLINTANLQWFQGTGLAQQRLRMAQARALEAGRPVLRAAHASIDAHIDHRGQLQAVQPNDGQDLFGQVQPMQGHTPYLRWVQAWLPAIWSLLLLLGGWWPVPRKRLGVD
jgi:apolipoprotein N-acyltransferase